MGLNFTSEWITLIYRRAIGKMSPGNNREEMGAWFIFAEQVFGTGWKFYSEGNTGKGCRVSYEKETHSSRHWDPPTKWVFGTQICPWVPAQICLEVTCWPPSISPALGKINFGGAFQECAWKRCCEGPWRREQQQGHGCTEKVATSARSLCVPQSAFGHKESSCCLPGGICRWFILYIRAKKLRNAHLQSSILGYYKELLCSSISTLNFLSELLHLQY